MIDHRGLLSLLLFHRRVSTKGLELAKGQEQPPRYLFCARRLSRYYAGRESRVFCDRLPVSQDTQTLGFSNYIPELGAPRFVIFVEARLPLTDTCSMRASNWTLIFIVQTMLFVSFEVIDEWII